MSRSTLNPTTRRPNAHSEAQFPRAATPSQDLGKVVQRVRASGGHRQQRVADILSLQGAIGNRATVQLLAAQARPGRGDGDGSHIHSAAAAGVQGGGGKLPHLDKLQNLFGGHDLGSVQAYTGPAAAAASRAIGAKAYTVGDKIAFDSPSPSPDIVAHEAAHVVQQRSGVRLKGGVGEVGDSYERQADAVGQAASRGESVERMLGGGSARGRGSEGGAGSASSGHSVQRYTVHNAGTPDEMFVSQNEELALKGPGQNTFFATTDKIRESNESLKNAGSFVRLTSPEESHPLTPNVLQSDDTEEDSDWAADVPKLSVNNKELHRVLARWETKETEKGLGIHAHKDQTAVSLDVKNQERKKDNELKEFTKRDPMYLWYDCGKSSAAVMGSPSVSRQGCYKKDGKDKVTDTMATPHELSSAMYKEMIPAFVEGHNNEALKTSYKDFAGNGVDKEKQFYFTMSAAHQKEFDAFVNINRNVFPEVGQGYAIASEKDVKGYKDAKKTDIYEWHWEGVVAKDGNDTVTLNNASNQNEFDATAADWKFDMYGPKEHQTFHDRMIERGITTNTATTLLVRTTPAEDRDKAYRRGIEDMSNESVAKNSSVSTNSQQISKRNLLERQSSKINKIDPKKLPSALSSLFGKKSPSSLNLGSRQDGQIPSSSPLPNVPQNNNIVASDSPPSNKRSVVDELLNPNFLVNSTPERDPNAEVDLSRDDDDWVDEDNLPEWEPMNLHGGDNALRLTREMIEKELDRRGITHRVIRELVILKALGVTQVEV